MGKTTIVLIEQAYARRTIFSRKQIATGSEMYAQTNALVRNNKRARSFSLAFFPFIVDSQRRSSYRVSHAV